MSGSRLAGGLASAALVLAAGSSAAPTAARPQAGLYRGKTTQSWNVSFRVSRDGTTIKPFVSFVTLACDQGGGPYAESRGFLPPGAARIRGMRFAREVSPGDGTTYTYAGRFTSPTRAAGTLTMGSSKLVLGGLEVCVTPGTVRWSARLRR